jgi:energy-coupling factor transport system ATP-binding protein
MAQVDFQDPVVKFSGVDFSHPNGIAALKNINLEINRGELIGILGTNGAGKSTLVRHINGLLKPTHGTVSVFGNDTKQASAASLSRNVGVVFQNANNQLFATSVRAEIEFGLKNFKLDEATIRDRTDWTLNTFGLQNYADTPPMELSGGEKKRLCTALVLAWDPDILILDEPTVGQDSQQKERLSDIIKLLVGQSRTVILVSHDVEFVWKLQPRTVLMHAARVVADGPAQKIMALDNLTSASNVLPPQLVDLFKLLSINSGYPRDEYEARDKLLPIYGKA